LNLYDNQNLNNSNDIINSDIYRNNNNNNEIPFNINVNQNYEKEDYYINTLKKKKRNLVKVFGLTNLSVI
jgi:hypothetical protein